MRLLSIELFGQSLSLPEFPKLKAIRGLGMTDKQAYADLLAHRSTTRIPITIVNRVLISPGAIPSLRVRTTSFFPRMYSNTSHRRWSGRWKKRAGCSNPHGFLGVTLYCSTSDKLREHFPELNEYRVVPLGNTPVLINRRRDGTLEISDNLVFHGGSGATLEMREFGITGLQAKLIAAGFREVQFLTDNLPEIGVLFDQDVSQPLIARKEQFVMDESARGQMVRLWREALEQAWRERDRADRLASQIQLGSQSRWVPAG